MYQLYMIEYLLLTIVYHTTATRGSFLCKEEPCSCCTSGTCADPHQHVLPCQGCIDGYAGPSCYEPCPEGCVNCRQLFYEYESERECYQCKAGFYNGRYKDIGSYPLQLDCSLPCMENCEMCTSYYNCNRCKPLFYPAYGKDCIRCLDNCLQCTSGTNCLACEDGHVWDGKVCAACPANCVQCTSGSDCLACGNGYFWNGVECVTCEAGYFGTNCSRKCPDTCVNLCDKSTGVCIPCNKRYFRNQNKICLRCPEHCNYCLSNELCFSCSAGYRGDTCQYKCSNCKPGTACNKFTGYCLNSCKNGSSGEYCDTSCSEGCVDKLCGRETGKCSKGCLPGLSGSNCSIVIQVEDNALPGIYVRAVAFAIVGITCATSAVLVYIYIRRKNRKLPVSCQCCNTLLHCRDEENKPRSRGPLVHDTFNCTDVNEAIALTERYYNDETMKHLLQAADEIKEEETTLMCQTASTPSVKTTDEEKGKSLIPAAGSVGRNVLKQRRNSRSFGTQNITV